MLLLENGLDILTEDGSFIFSESDQITRILRVVPAISEIIFQTSDDVANLIADWVGIQSKILVLQGGPQEPHFDDDVSAVEDREFSFSIPSHERAAPLSISVPDPKPGNEREISCPQIINSCIATIILHTPPRPPRRMRTFGASRPRIK